MKTTRSITLRLWDGVRMRSTVAAADPDDRALPVILPAAWPEACAPGLAALAAGTAAADLRTMAEPWLGALPPALAARAHGALLAQAGAPADAAWGGAAYPCGYVLNLAAPGEQDIAAAARIGRDVAASLWPRLPHRLLLTGLAGWLAARGLAYDSAAAREAACGLLGAIRAAAPGALLAVQAPGPVDALLGVETAGIAPPFGPLDEAGALSRESLAFLAARGIGPAAALAAALAGGEPIPLASRAAHAAMDAALRPLLDEAPALRRPMPPPSAQAARQDLPARRGGFAQKATVGGQKVFLRTGDYADGRLGEVSVSLPQGSPAVRGLIECLSHVISTALQHGAPLADILDAMAGTRFGTAGTVEGDPSVPRATSPLDYAARVLAQHYLPQASLPPAEDDGEAAAPPLLPLELPRELLPRDAAAEAPPPPPARRRGLRVVR